MAKGGLLSVMGAVVGISYGKRWKSLAPIRRKSLEPLVLLCIPCTMLEIIIENGDCEKESAEEAERQKKPQNSAADASLTETISES